MNKYYVHILGKGEPNQAHGSIEEAKKEVNRLLNDKQLNKSQIRIYKVEFEATVQQTLLVSKAKDEKEMQCS